MPAMPPAVRPCGRTLEALNRSNWACRVTKTRSTSSSCGRFDAQHRVLVLERDDFPVLTVQRVVRLDALDDALGGADGEDRHPAGTNATSVSPLSRVMKSFAGTPPARFGSPDVGGQDGHVHDLQAEHPALGGHRADLARARRS